jgi:N6-adenosine-specific RNA methylase IME4
VSTAHARLVEVLVADPPWNFKDKLPGETRGAVCRYQVQTLKQILRFPLPPIADTAILFLWRVSSQVEEAYAVCRTWGFVPKTEIVWNKTTKLGLQHFGMGHYVRAAHESCIVATRGSFKVSDRSVRSTFGAAVGEHSEKPDAFFELVERLVGGAREGAMCEMFGRKVRPGWHVYGNEIPGGYCYTAR